MTTDELKAAEREKVEHIRLNMHTRKKWSLGDFRDFYQRDVEYLLSLADAYLARLAADERAACIERRDGLRGRELEPLPHRRDAPGRHGPYQRGRRRPFRHRRQ